MSVLVAIKCLWLTFSSACNVSKSEKHGDVWAIVCIFSLICSTVLLSGLENSDRIIALGFITSVALIWVIRQCRKNAKELKYMLETFADTIYEYGADSEEARELYWIYCGHSKLGNAFDECLRKGLNGKAISVE